MQITKDLLTLPSIQNIEEVIQKLNTPVTLTKGQFSNLEFRFINNVISIIHLNKDIRKFSDVWLNSYWETRDLAYAVKLYLEHFKTPHTFVEQATSKITDQIIFAINKINLPNTFFIDNANISNHLATIEDICGYPLIIKDITGSGGRHSEYVENRADLVTKSAQLAKHKKYLYQKFIPNDYDWGVLISNGRIISAEKSYPDSGEFRNNSCNGAKEIFVDIKDLPKHIGKMALEASKALGLSWSRVDIVVDKTTAIAYLMEVNRCPGISTGTSEITGAQSFLQTHLNTLV